MRIHIVGRGETLLEIAKKTGLPAARLAAENGLAPASRLTEGQSLLYTRPARLRAVRHGERAGDLCRAEDLSLRRFLRLNPMQETDDRLPVGQELAVAQSAVPFGQMAVFGILSEKAPAEDCAASLPYMTCLVCEGCRFAEDRIYVPASARRLRMRYPALMPSLWAAVGPDVLPWLLCRGGTEKLPALLREAGLEGICIVRDTDGVHFCGGRALPVSPCRMPPEEQRDNRGAREADGSGSPDGIGRLREVLTDAGMGMCVCVTEIPADPGEISGFPCLLRGTEGEGLTAACRRIGATENGLRRRMLWPRLPDSATCHSVWPDGTRQTETVDLRQIPALLERCRPTVRREEGGASFSYRTRAGRQAIRHEMYFEDAFSLSEGLYEMNRRGLGGVWCDAARVPLWMLYMLSVCYEIVDPRPRG